MSRRIKKVASDDQVKKAIDWLENGGTKKGACEILDVASNSTMERIIEDWKERQITIAEMKKKKRGTEISGIELANIIEGYLSGDSIDDLAERNYRSTMKVKAVLEENGALLRQNTIVSPNNPPDIPDIIMELDFMEKEIVWVAAYQCLGEIVKKLDNDVYRIYLLDESKHRYVHQHSYDLASMKHFESLGVDIKNLYTHLGAEEVKELLFEALKAAKKNEQRK